MTETPDVLKRILRRKVEEIAERCEREDLRTLSRRIEGMPPTRGFATAIRERVATGRTAIIAEIKRASPSKGLLRRDFSPTLLAQSYERGGATCLSVLTDHDFFGGSEQDLHAASTACTLPVLRKDFIVDPYQVYEARVIGADCLLLIVAALGDAQLVELTGLAAHLDIDVLVEVHDAEELDRALALPVELIGINNRDLRTFQTDLATTLRLLERVPQGRIVVTESGIQTRTDVAQLHARGVNAFLVGEAFMRASDPGARLLQLFGRRS